MIIHNRYHNRCHKMYGICAVLAASVVRPSLNWECRLALVSP